MKKLSNYLPITILLLIPILYIENNLNGSFITASNIIAHHGYIALFKEMLTPSFQPALLTLLLFLFVKYLAPNMSLFLGSILLILFYHAFFPAALFFEILQSFYSFLHSVKITIPIPLIYFFPYFISLY